eukprot:TRINITY_DN7913_c1_g1_i1.p1 TRINITY_DN7913_c1_g1~~TRINITY_DN7913_c1_g1_i1.p1  ORF type:complete len:1884 (+),score=361.31 TRINITY_DN7913_c1_g1_i1:58-5652(+)
MAETEQPSRLFVEMMEKLTSDKGIDGLVKVESELSVLKADDIPQTEMIQLKKRLLVLVGEKCNRLEEQEGAQIVDLVQRVTERGFDTYLTESMFPVLQSLITSANITEGGQSFWSSTCSMCFQLMANSLKSSFNSPISAFGSTVSPDNVNYAINAVWSAFYAAFDNLPPTLVKDAVSILFSLQKRIDLSKVPETVAQNYLSVLCMGGTLTELEMAPPVHGTPPVRSMGLSPPSVSDSLHSVGALSSVAHLCRNSLVYHLKRDTYITLYYLRLFLHANHAQAVSVSHQQHVQQVAMKPPNLTPRDVSIIRGSIASLRIFIFETAKTSEDLSVKELLVILGSLRYSLVVMDRDVTLDVACFLDQLLRNDVSRHLESHWYTITLLMSDLLGIYFKHTDPALQTKLSELLTHVHSRLDTIELNHDRDRTVLLIDSFSAYLEPQIAFDLIHSIFRYQLLADPSLERLHRLMSKYLLGACYNYSIKADCLKIFKKMQPHTRPGWLKSGLLTLIESQHNDKEVTFFGWDAALAVDVVLLLEEYLGYAFLEGNSVEKNCWSDLLQTCCKIVLHSPEKTSLPVERRFSLGEKMILAAKEAMVINSQRCLDLWTQIMKLLDHESPKVRSEAFNYFKELHCNEDFEVHCGNTRSASSFSPAIVAREVSYSFEVQFPMHLLLSALNSKLSSDSESFGACLQLIYQYLQNCYFIAGDAARNAPALRDIVSTLSSLVSDRFDILMKVTSPAPLQDILSIVVAIVPYICSHEGTKEDLAVGILQFLKVLQQKIMETTILFPIQSEVTVSVLRELFSAVHIVVIQFITTENVMNSRRVKEAAAEMMSVLSGTISKMTSIADKIRELPQSQQEHQKQEHQQQQQKQQHDPQHQQPDQQPDHSNSVQQHPPQQQEQHQHQEQEHHQPEQQQQEHQQKQQDQQQEMQQLQPQEQPQDQQQQQQEQQHQQREHQEQHHQQEHQQLQQDVHHQHQQDHQHEQQHQHREQRDHQQDQDHQHHQQDQHHHHHHHEQQKDHQQDQHDHQVQQEQQKHHDQERQQEQEQQQESVHKEEHQQQEQQHLDQHQDQKQQEQHQEVVVSPSQPVPGAKEQPAAFPAGELTGLSGSISSLAADVSPPPPFSVTASHPKSSTAVQCKQCVINIISLIHSLVTSPLVDDRTPHSQISHKILFKFTETSFQFLIDVIDSTQFEHRIYFMAHLTVAEMLQHNKRGMFSPSSRQSLLLRLSGLLRPHAGAKARFSRKPHSEDEESRTATNRELVKATMDLAWRMFYLGSADAYPHWDILTETIFANGETQCWAIQGPHAPCIISTTTGSSQHMLVTIRSLTATNCWCCILHNKPTLPPYYDRPYIPPTNENCEEDDTESRLALLGNSVPSVDLLQDHDDEMRGLIPLESSYSSLQTEKDDLQQSTVFKSLTDQESDSLRSSPQIKDLIERKRQSSLCSSEELRDSPVPPSPNRIGSVGKFAPIGERRDRQGSPNSSNIAMGSKNESFSDELSLSSHVSCPPSYHSPQPARNSTPNNFEKPGLEELLTNTIHGAFILSMFKMSPAPQRLKWDEALLRSLQALDKVPCKETHKIGLVYIDHDQYRPDGRDIAPDSKEWEERELEVLRNDNGSSRYQHFMCGLGRFRDLKIPREDKRETVKRGIWPHPCHYFGALDSIRQEDGETCLMYESSMHQMVYHVATIMPNVEPDADSDPQIARRKSADKKKRHIGNDHVVVTYCEDTSRNIDPFVLKNELNYINILVQPLADGYSRVTIHFKDNNLDKRRALLELLDESAFGPAVCSRVGLVVPDTRLSHFVGLAAIHASISTKSWRFERQQYQSNWGDRLRRISQLPVRFAVKPENKTSDDIILDEYHYYPSSPS